jgi:hypothetical protein
MAQNLNLGLLGQYINVTTTSVAFTSNVTVSTNSSIVANGSIGIPGQILTSNGATVYWANSTGSTIGKAIAMTIVFGG